MAPDQTSPVRASRRNAWIRPVLGLAIAVVALWVLSRGANRPADPSLAPADTSTPAAASGTGASAASVASTVVAVAASGLTASGRTAVPGFGEVAFTITDAAGVAGSTMCALLAADEPAREHGMMTRHDLAGHDGMVFRFDADSDAQFYMRNVPVALDIAWFDSSGKFVSSASMPPCEDRDGCPVYPAARPYRYAIETLPGGVAKLGIGPGARLNVARSCPEVTP